MAVWTAASDWESKAEVASSKISTLAMLGLYREQGYFLEAIKMSESCPLCGPAWLSPTTESGPKPLAVASKLSQC